MLKIYISKEDHDKMVSSLNFKKDVKIGEVGEKITKSYFESIGNEFIEFNRVKKDLKKWDLKIKKDLVYYLVESKADTYCRPEQKVWSEVFKKEMIIPEVETGNMFIERECRGNLSGISTTESDYWSYTFYFLNEIWLIKTDKLRKLISENDFKVTVDSGDTDSNTRGYLIPRFEFRDWFEVIPFETIVLEPQEVY